MDKLIASASVGLAKAGMNRRGFLGRLARATGGAVVLSAAFASVANANHCGHHHRCITDYFEWVGQCGHRNCPIYTSEARWKRYRVKDCYTKQDCGWHYVWSHCEANACPTGS